MRDNVTAIECCMRLMQIHSLCQRKADILSINYDISIDQ